MLQIKRANFELKLLLCLLITTFFILTGCGWLKEIFYGKDPEPPTRMAKRHFDEGLRYENERNWALAVEEFRKALKLHPDYPDPIYELGNCYFNLKAYKKSIECFTWTIENCPGYFAAYRRRGFCHAQLGDWKKAVDDLKEYRKRLRAEIDKSELDKWIREFERRRLRDMK